MGLRGFPPKPTAIKKLEGNPGRRPLPENEPEPPAIYAPVKPPTWLRGKGKQVWNTICPMLISVRVLTEADLLALSRYCDLFEEFFTVRKHVKKHGTTYPIMDGEGRLVKVAEFPQFKQYRTLNRDLLRMEQEFGLTPAARTRVRALLGSGDDNPPPLPPQPGQSAGGDDEFDFGD